MKAIEFPVRISESKNIEIPDKYKKNLTPNQKVKVILLLEDSSDEDWNEATLREFFRGYGEKDSIYDSVK